MKSINNKVDQFLELKNQKIHVINSLYEYCMCAYVKAAQISNSCNHETDRTYRRVAGWSLELDLAKEKSLFWHE